MVDFSPSQASVKGRVLVVDDEARLRDTMGTSIRQEGYSVDEASTGEQALELLQRTCYDVMTLDMVMPGIGGVEVIRQARVLQPDLSIIVLTGFPTVDSAIAAVKNDVTDYLLKPCTLEDLSLILARTMQERVRQHQRQRLLAMVGEAIDTLRQADTPTVPTPTPALPVGQPTSNENLLRVGALTLDREKRMVTCHTQPPRTIELTEGETAILIAMMKTPNQVFTYSQLANSALGYRDMDKWTVESIIRSSVFRLRQKIEADADNPQFIRTVRGRGYFFAPV